MARAAARTWVIALAALYAGVAYSQNFPHKPVRFVTGDVGGGSDFAARLISQAMAGNLGQQVIVENRGGSGVIPAQIVAGAPADGYTMLFFGSAFWLLPFMQQNVPFDPLKDFVPVTLAVSAPNILVVHPALPVTSVKDFIANAKLRPGALNYASGPTGASNHLGAELFKAMAGVDLVRVAYKGTGPALLDVIAGQVQVMFPQAGGAMPQVKAGRVRALAVTSSEPSALAPGLPTVASSGLPGYESVTISGIFAPARTPAVLINRLNQEIVRALARADVKEKFFNAGVETVGSTPQRLTAAVKTEMTVLGKLIKNAGIRDKSRRYER